MSRWRGLGGSFGIRISDKDQVRYEHLLDKLPRGSTKNAKRMTERKAKEMVSHMKVHVPKDTLLMMESIKYTLYKQGMKAKITAGVRKGGRVAKYMEFGTKQMEKRPFFLPVIRYYGEGYKKSIQRSLQSAVNKAVREAKAKG